MATKNPREMSKIALLFDNTVPGDLWRLTKYKQNAIVFIVLTDKMEVGWLETSEQFWNASLEELKRGYTEEAGAYRCILCGQTVEKGIVYPEEGILYEAERYMQLHIQKSHESVFASLLKMDRKLTGLTDHQKNLMQLFYQGKSDADIKRELGMGSTSTIRNHRFVLKEKERQARILLALMELLKDRDRHAPALLSIHKGALQVDERYNTTLREKEQILKRYFTGGAAGSPGRLKTFIMKEKSRLVVLAELARGFEPGRVYSEKEIDLRLKASYDDYVTLRRCLVDYGFLERLPDGSQYWVKS